MAVSWTINGVTLGAYELSQVALRRVNQQPDTLSFVHDGALFDGDLIFDHGAEIVLRRDGVIWFRGKIRETPRRGAVAGESISYVARGGWDQLTRKAYLQSFAEPTDPNNASSPLAPRMRGRIILGQDSAGVKVNLSTAIASIITYAGFLADVDLGDVVVPYDEATDYSCADAVTRLLQWATDAVVWFDDSTTPTTVHVRRRADLAAIDVAVEGGLVGSAGITLNPRYDLLVEHVCLIYIATNRSNSASWDVTTRDVYPVGTTGEEDNCFVRTIRLAGSVEDSSYLTQAVDTDDIPAALVTPGLVTTGTVYNDLLTWWKKKHPWIGKEGVIVKGFRNGQRLRVPDENPSTTVTPNLRELTKGALTDWMVEEDAGLKTEQQNVSVDIVYELVDADDSSKVQRKRMRLEATIVATNAQTKTYTVLESASSTPPEAVPSALAPAIHAALSVLQQEGSIMLQERECSGVVTMGNVVNLTESREEWEDMGALVQSVTFDLDNGQTAIDVGPPSQLGIDSLVEIYQSNRNRQPVTSTYSRATGSSAATRKQSLPRWQPTRAAQSGTDVTPRVYTVTITLGDNKVPTAAMMKAAVESVYSAANTPIFNDLIGIKVGEKVKFRATVSATDNGAAGIFSVQFSAGTPAVNYYALVSGVGIF